MSRTERWYLISSVQRDMLPSIQWVREHPASSHGERSAGQPGRRGPIPGAPEERGERAVDAHAAQAEEERGRGRGPGAPPHVPARAGQARAAGLPPAARGVRAAAAAAAARPRSAGAPHRRSLWYHRRRYVYQAEWRRQTQRNIGQVSSLCDAKNYVLLTIHT